MSRNINVNPAHYKLRGRERQGEEVLHAMQKQAFSQQAEGERWRQHHEQPMAPPHPPEQVAAEQAMAEPEEPKRTRTRRRKAPRKAASRKAAPRKAATRRKAATKKATRRRVSAPASGRRRSPR